MAGMMPSPAAAGGPPPGGGAPAPGGMPGPESLMALLAQLQHGGASTGDGAKAGHNSLATILPILLKMLMGGGAPGAPGAAPGPPGGAPPQMPPQGAPGQGSPDGGGAPPMSPQVMQIVQMLHSLGLMPGGSRGA